MSLHGTPDWSQPLSAPGGELYFGYQTPRRAFAPPLELAVAQDGRGHPAIAVEQIRLEGGAHGPEVLGLFTVRFFARHALEVRQRHLFVVHPEVKLEALPPTTGFVRFEAADALEVPAELRAPRPLVWAGAGSLTLAARLGGGSTTLLADALRNGLVPVTAVAEVEVWGVARRAAAEVTVRMPALAPLLPREACTLEALAAALIGAPDAALAVRGVATDEARREALLACADRLIARLGTMVAAADPARGATYALDPSRAEGAELVWDLSLPVRTPRGFVVRSSPLDAAREALARGFVPTREAPPVSFATGLHVISVLANLPAKRVGVLAIGADLRAPPVGADRTTTAVGSATFREGEASKTVPLRLSPREALGFDYQAFAFVLRGGGAERLSGPLRHHDDTHLTLPPDCFPVRFVRVEAAPALLRSAQLQLRCTGRRADLVWSLETKLDATTPAVALAVPHDLQDGALSVVASDGARTCTLPSRPLEDAWIDASTFPSAGPARIEVRAVLAEGQALLAIECAPEDRLHVTEDLSLLRFTRAQVSREHRWLVTDPLRDRLCWRWFRPAGEPPAPWSEPLDPASGPLVVQQTAAPDAAGGDVTMETFELAGAQVTADPAQPGTYLYAPLAPSVALDAQGRPQLSLLTAGTTTFFQITAALGLGEAQLAALRTALGARTGLDPASLTLRPRPDTVREVVLELGQPGGVMQPLQVGRSSGVPPHHALFNVMLDAGQRAAVEAALAGERGRLSLRYEVLRAPPAAATSTTRATHHETTRAVVDGVETTTTTTTTHEIRDDAGSPAAPPLSLRLDAADWTARR